MSTGVRHAPPSLLSVLTMPARGQAPWVQEPGALRIVMDPSVGWPLGPFLVVFWPQALNVDTLESVEWRLFGEQGAADVVEREAWLVLAARDSDSDPGLVDVEVAEYDEPPEIAVVRQVGDGRLGLATRTEPPYRLCAPAVSTLRIRGRCRIVSVRVSSIFSDISLQNYAVVGAPVGPIEDRYYGTDPDGAKAGQRVQIGAPSEFAPHELLPSPGANALVEELDRVQHLADAGISDSLHAVLAAAPGDHATSTPIDVDGHPRPTSGTVQDRMTALIAATDVGVARWLGLADQLVDVGSRTLTVTAMSIWALRDDHPLARHASALSQRPYIEPFLEAADLAQMIALADKLANAGFRPLWLYSQAYVDLDVPPDRPPPPTLAAGPPIWLRGATEGDDVALLPIKTHGVAVLGQVGLSRKDPDPGPLPRTIPGSARLQPLLAVEGPAVADRAAAPFDPRTYVGWQSDAFGRWCDDPSNPLTAEVSRVPLPIPDPMVRVLPSSPTGQQSWTPELLVRTAVPPRAGGQWGTAKVRVEAGSSDLVDAAGQDTVDVQVSAPAIAPGEAATATVSVTFLSADETQSSPTAVRTVEIVDPRPPAPPPLPPVLNFASRPDATGVATAVVPLPAAPGVSAYFVEIAREGDLVVAAQTEPPAGLTRDARAQFWLQQPRNKLASAFYRVTQAPVAVGSYPHALPGDAGELVAFRLVPVGPNNASADPSQCGFTFYAVPRDVAPPPPILLLDRSSTPPVLEVRAAPGAVPAADVRIRALSDPHADPRTGRVVAGGTLQNGTARIPAPAGAKGTYVAEVRGESEAGVTPALGRWSAPSTPVQV